MTPEIECLLPNLKDIPCLYLNSIPILLKRKEGIIIKKGNINHIRGPRMEKNTNKNKEEVSSRVRLSSKARNRSSNIRGVRGTTYQILINSQGARNNLKTQCTSRTPNTTKINHNNKTTDLFNHNLNNNIPLNSFDHHNHKGKKLGVVNTVDNPKEIDKVL